MDLGRVKEIRERMTTYPIVRMMRAVPMTRGEYHLMRGNKSYGGFDPREEGYLVEIEGEHGPTNLEGFEGGVHWLSKGEFKETYGLSGHYLDRMKMELEYLRGNIQRLKAFVDSPVAKENELTADVRIAKEQLEHMELYEACLSVRIKIDTRRFSLKKGKIYKAKSNEVLAIQWNGSNLDEVKDFLNVVKEKSESRLSYDAEYDVYLLLLNLSTGDPKMHVRTNNFLVYDEVLNVLVVMDQEKFAKAYQSSEEND